MPAKQPKLSPSLTGLLAAFGDRLRLARLRRHMTVADACQRAGISRMTLFRAEMGSSAVAMGTYLRILSVLKLESDLGRLASEDRVGRMLQDLELPRPRRMTE